nr:TPA_asm: oncoid [Orchesella springtail adintovirus]
MLCPICSSFEAFQAAVLYHHIGIEHKCQFECTIKYHDGLCHQAIQLPNFCINCRKVCSSIEEMMTHIEVIHGKDIEVTPIREIVERYIVVYQPTYYGGTTYYHPTLVKFNDQPSESNPSSNFKLLYAKIQSNSQICTRYGDCHTTHIQYTIWRWSTNSE